MSSFTKKIVAIATALSVTVMVAGPVAAQSVSDLQAQIAALTAQLASLTAQLNSLSGSSTTTGGVTGCTITSFTQNLSQGMTGNDVKCLQIILNSSADTQVAASGAGSPGNETTYFGSLTKAAVVKFQNKYAANVLAPLGLTAGTGYVGPSTRTQLNSMLSTSGGGTVVVPGTNSVALSSSTPGASAVAQGAADVPFTAVTFSAGATAYTVNSIAVTRSGISANTDVTNIKLYDGSTQVGSTQALNNTTNQATFTNLNWTIPANTVKTLTIEGTINSTNQGDSIVLGIASASDISASVTLSGTFPINGNPMTIAGAGAAVGALGVSFASTPATGTILSGATDQQVGTLKLTSSGEGFNVNSIKLTDIGTTGNNDISNITLKYGATVLGSAASMTNNTVTITGSPLINIPVGTTRNIDVYVDTASGINTNRTVIMEVTQASDIVAIGTNSGGQVSSTSTFPTDAQAQTIGQGSLSVSLDAATNPPAQSYVIGSTNRDFLALKFSAGSTEGARLAQINLTLNGTLTSTDISNISLYDGDTLLATGVLNGTTVQFGSYAVNSFSSTGLVDIPASGNKTLTVEADISSGANSAHTGYFSITSSQIKGYGLTSQISLPTSAITGSASGQTMSLSSSGTLSLYLDGSSPAAQAVAPGTQNKIVAAYALTAGSGEDILVSSMTVNLYNGSGTGTATVSGDVTNVSLWDGTTQLGTTVSSPVSSAAFNTNLIVPAGTTKIVTVQLTIPSGTSASSVHADLTTSNVSATGVSSNATIGVTGGATGNLMSIASPGISVAMASVPAASYQVYNTRGVTMGEILLTAGTAENVVVNQIKVSFSSSSATLATSSSADTSLSNVKLYDGATQIGNTMTITSSSNGDYALFTGLNDTIPAGQTKAIAVVVDITGTSGTFYTGIATTSAVTGAGAISGTAVASTATNQISAGLSIISKGTLTIDVDSGTPVSSNIAVGTTQGAQGVSYSSLKFSALYENIKLSSIAVSRSGGSDSNFGAIYLYNGSTLVGTSYLNGGVATFNYTPGNEIVVPANGNITLTVKADDMGIGAGSTSGTSSVFYLAGLTSASSTGASSQQAITATTTSSSVNPTTASNFNAQYLYRTTASVALAGPTGGASVAAANQTVLMVSVTNNGVYDLNVTKFTVTPRFSGTSSAPATDYTDLYTSQDNYTTAIATGTAVTTSGTSISLAPTTNNVVPAGQTVTFKVTADTTGAITSGSTRSFHMDIDAGNLGWDPTGANSATYQVTTLTPGMPITGPTFTY